MEKSNLERLLEMAQAGIKWYDQSRPVSVDLVWDREAYERAVKGVIDERNINDLAAKSGVLPQNIAELNPSELVGFLVDEESYWNAIKDSATIFNVLPQDVAKLNPVQLTALVIYTLQERRELGEISQTKYLKLVGDALDTYKTISGMSEVPFPQGNEPLRFFRETFPNMIRENGYIPARAVLQDFARGSILDEKFILSDRDLETIIYNIRNSNKLSDILQEFHMDDGLELHLYTGDEEKNNQVNEVVWRSVPRLIEAKGYQTLEAVINSRIRRARRLALYEAIRREQGKIRYAEVFENTTRGRLVYVAPDRVDSLVSYLHGLVSEQNRLEKQERRKQNRYRGNQTAAISYHSQPKVTPDSIDEVKDVEAPVSDRSVYRGHELHQLSSTYRSALLPPSGNRSTNRVWNLFHGATTRYISFLQTNPELAAEFEAQLRTDISSGEEFIIQLRRQHQPKEYTTRFEEGINELKVYLPESASQPQHQATGLKRFFSILGR